ncbi:hypothetical protein [Actinokineospora pegani]|uniref:hypothetical protein n=1 Tax=Actinokineospora pegani TaxID=2654637 RepID=UPI0012EACEFF|nr:hypothetical protein [Actinokineospora pegani]
MRGSRRESGLNQLSLWSTYALHERATYQEPTAAKPAHKRKPRPAPRKVTDTTLTTTRQPTTRARSTRRTAPETRCRTGARRPS